MFGWGPLGSGPLGAGPSGGSSDARSTVLGLGVGDTLSAILSTRVAETLSLDAHVGGGSTEVEIVEELEVTIGVGTPEFGAEATDGLEFSELVEFRREFTDELEQGFRFELVPEAIRAVAGVASDTLGVEVVMLTTPGYAVVEQLAIADVMAPGQILLPIAVDGVQLRDLLYRAIPLALVETVGVELATLSQEAASVVEELEIASALTGGGLYQITLTQALRFADALGRFVGVDATDGIGIEPVEIEQLLARATLAETVGVEMTVSPRLLVAVRVSEEIDLEQIDIVQMLLNPTLADGIALTGGYLAPDGSLTTWAMNARTGAVTEYSNYAFNSFARMGNRYVGASTDGLYELLGDDDEGVDIVARIESGFLQFGGTRLSRLKAAYIAARGEGAFVLRIVDGDGASYDYAVDTRNQRSTKVHMGKGQRSRYFSFELISEGQDFDLDTLEFVPIVVERRV